MRGSGEGGRGEQKGRLGITAPYREAPLLLAGVAGDLAAAVFGEAADQFAAQGGHFDFDARVGGVAGRGGGFVGAEANGQQPRAVDALRDERGAHGAGAGFGERLRAGGRLFRGGDVAFDADTRDESFGAEKFRGFRNGGFGCGRQRRGVALEADRVVEHERAVLNPRCGVKRERGEEREEREPTRAEKPVGV